MKAMMAVLFILFFAACGSATQPACKTDKDCGANQKCVSSKCVDVECTTDQDCGTNQKCVLSICEDKNCWSDADCVSLHGVGWMCDTVNNVCVEKPECLIDADCNDPNLGCVNYKCMSYLKKDDCYNRPCTDKCASCGYLTSCEVTTNTCIGACQLHEELSDHCIDEGCAGLSDVCMRCYCWNNGHKDYNPGPTPCVDRQIKQCTIDQEGSAKTSDENRDWNACINEVAAACKP